MPISYRIDGTRHVVHIEFRGRVTVDEFVRGRATMAEDPAFDPGMHRITDVRALTELPRIDDLREIARLTSVAQRPDAATVRRALIVESPASYGVARQYQTLLSLSGHDVDILVGDQEAERWIAELSLIRDRDA